MKTSIKITLLIVAIFLFSSISIANPLYIGAALPLTGENAAEGMAMKLALEMYLEDFNNKGGVNGTPLHLLVEDDGNDPQKAVTAAQKLANNKNVLAVIGHQYSSVALAAGGIYQKAGLLHVTPSASNPEVTRSQHNVFSMVYQDIHQGGSIAVYLSTVLKARRILVIHCDDAYGEGLANSFLEKSKKLGLTIVSSLSFNDKRDKATEFVGKTPAKSEVDAIVLFTHMNGGMALIKSLRKKGYSQAIIGPDAFAKHNFITGLGKYTKEVYITSPFLYELASLKTKKFADEYKARYLKRYGVQPTTWAAFCYDAIATVTEGLCKKGTSRKELVKYFYSLTKDSNRWGITGKIKFDEQGARDCPVVVSTIDGDRFIPAFTQIRPVIDPTILKNIEKKVSSGEVVIADGIPYYLTRVVYVGLDFYRINSVDVANQNFDIEFFLWYRWMGQVDVQNIDFLNGIYGIEDKTEVIRQDQSGPVKYICYKIKGTYLTPYDLHDFPFDCQRLPMTLSHKSKDANAVMLVVDEKNLSHHRLETIYPEEWIYQKREDYAGTYAAQSTFGDPNYTKGVSKVEFSIYETNISIKRILHPYLITMFLPLWIMIVISVLVFLIPREQFDSRMTLVTTALLTIIVFHLSQEDALPAVGYLVKADLYFMAAYVLTFCLIMESIAINRLQKNGHELLAKKIDRHFARVILPCTVLSLIYFVVTTIL